VRAFDAKLKERPKFHFAPLEDIASSIQY